jgi:hypothetical protein
LSLAAMRFLIVRRLTAKCPSLRFAQ